MITAAELAAALSARPYGDGWTAPCFFPERHRNGDVHPSMRIFDGRDGYGKLHCPVCGNGSTRELMREAERRGLLPKSNGKAPTARIVAEYNYTDANGKLVGQVVRLEPKSFRQRRPDGRGGWIWGLKGTTLPLYHAPQIANSQHAIVVEGEKDADALQGLGLPATCNPGGAGKWRHQHTEVLAGKRVAIIADTDEPGRRHARQVAAALRGTAETVRVIEPPEGHKDAAAWLAAGATRDDILEAIKSAPEWEPEPEAEPDRPEIRIVPGELPRMVDEADAALTAAPDHLGMYQRGGLIVRVVRHEKHEDGVLRRAAGTPTIQAVPPAALLEKLTAAARWVKWDARSEDWLPRDCPRLVADAYAARTGEWRLRPLAGVLDAPTLRRDGTILQEPGHDERSGLLLLDADFPRVPDHPTRADAVAALEALKAPLRGFPFGGNDQDREPSRAVALAAILTACIRHALPTAPMFLFDAPAPGTGKSLLADVVALIATGRPAAAMSQARDPEEDAKRLLAVLMEGAGLICIDNVDAPLEGAALNAILTQATYKGRILGVSKTAQVPTAATFLATGNNLIVRGDLVRRVVLCRLDAGVERPEERRFTTDLRADVAARRRGLVGAALTVLRAYHVAGRPPQEYKPFGSFEQWSAWVRGSLMWLGEHDPCATQHRVQTSDETMRHLDALLDAWEGRFETSPATVKQALYDAPESLLNAAVDVAGDNQDHVNSRRLGKWLVRQEGRIAGFRRFVRGPGSGHVRTWRVEHAER